MIFISPASGTQAGGLSLGNWSAESHVACLSFHFSSALHWKNRRRRTVAADYMFSLLLHVMFLEQVFLFFVSMLLSLYN